MVNREKVEAAVRLLLEGIGEDVNREGLVETPARIARMYEEIFAGMEEDPSVPLSRQFTAEGAGMVLEKDICFYSTCEHHLMPFFGKAQNSACYFACFRNASIAPEISTLVASFDHSSQKSIVALRGFKVGGVIRILLGNKLASPTTSASPISNIGSISA